jgi:flavodoxin
MAMKRSFVLALTLFCMGVTMELQAQSGGKILVAYFSLTGNSHTIAEQIQKEAGGELFEIKTVKPYPNAYNATIEVAKKEQQDNARPELTAKVGNMAYYDVIFLGFPCWWGTMPMACFTFLESYDFAGKTIIPFTTHGGSRFGNSINDIKRLAPKATLRDGIAIYSGYGRAQSDKPFLTAPQNEVTAWLKKLGLVK